MRTNTTIDEVVTDLAAAIYAVPAAEGNLLDTLIATVEMYKASYSYDPAGCNALNALLDGIRAACYGAAV